MMKTKIHENPEFQVIRQNEANAKFFVASPIPDGGVSSQPNDGISGNPSTVSLGKTSANGWF